MRDSDCPTRQADGMIGAHTRPSKGAGMSTHTLASSVILGVLATAAAGGSDAAPGELVQRWVFRTPADAEGFSSLHDLRNMRVADNALHMDITGPDAYFSLPPIDLPLDGLTLRVRMRCDRGGDSQVYWITRDQPVFTGSRHTSELTPPHAGPRTGPAGRGDFVTVNFPIGSPKDAGQRLTGLRLDPYNRNTAGQVEIASIELFRVPPAYEANLAPAACRFASNEPTTFRAVSRQRAGRLGSEAIYMSIVDGVAPGNGRFNALFEQVTAPATQDHVLTREFRFDQPGVHTASAMIRPATGSPVFDLESSVIIGEGSSLPSQPSLRTDRLRLDLIPTSDTRAIGAARWQIAGPDGGYRQAGWLLPLAELTLESAAGQVIRHHPRFQVASQSDSEVRLSATVEQNGIWNVELVFRPAVAEDVPFIDVRATLIGPPGGRLLDFSGPVLRADRDNAQADPLDRFAIFGGLEFLEPGWRSSSDRAVGPKFADRWTPHPFKVCLPVMAVEAAGLTTSLMWQPLEAWGKSEAMPTATFASPNFLDGQACHLMRLSIPTIPRWRAENESVARQAYITAPEEAISLHYALVGEFDTPAAMTARTWYRIFGPPKPAPSPHNNTDLWNLYARHFGETMYWAADKGWRHHWYLDNESAFVPWMAAELLAHAAATGDRRWVEATHLTGKPIIDTAGTLAVRVTGTGPADAAIRSMRSDDTWAYVNAPRVREQARKSTEGQFDSLGEDGSTSLGTCVLNALPILRYALLTGKTEYIQVGTQALESMRQFRVPRGAQVWEVHKDIPDIRAAALAVEAYRLGYQITGDQRWLDEAAYWAWTGVPFLYSWQAPVDLKPGYLAASRDRNAQPGRIGLLPLTDAFENPRRQVTPFGSIPVLGPTFYVSNWFGVIVQWCGLEWAREVIELDRLRPDPLLRAIADGVVASGLQQTFDKPPWVGLYPDVWDTQTNIAQGAFICGLLPLQCLQGQGRLPAWTRPWTRILRDPNTDRTRHLSGWGREPDLDWPVAGNPLIVTTDFLPNEPNELVVANADPPRLIRVGETLLNQSNKPGPGWRYDPMSRAVFVRFIQSEPKTVIRVEW